MSKNPRERLATSSIKSTLHIRGQSRMSNEGKCAIASCTISCLLFIERNLLVFSPMKVTNLSDAFSYYSRTLKSSYDDDVYQRGVYRASRCSTPSCSSIRTDHPSFQKRTPVYPLSTNQVHCLAALWASSLSIFFTSSRSIFSSCRLRSWSSLCR